MIERVDLLLASAGNHFMVEIAELYQHGFEQLGVPCRIVFDECPGKAEDPGAYPLIVAPHEYFALYADRAHGKARRSEILSRAGILNTEQPGSLWFDFTAALARYARNVFDLSRAGARAFHHLGVSALYAPIGYAPTLENTGAPHDGSKSVDIVFLGHSALRRDCFFAQNRATFQRYECRLLFVRVDRPRGPGGAGCLFGAERSRLLRSAKILINLHSSERSYFEWHRALCAIANRCLLVTETSAGMAPLIAGAHLVMADIDQLAPLCEHYLHDDDARAAIVDRAYRLLHRELSIEGSCRAILDAARTGPASRPEGTFTTRASQYWGWAAQTWRRLTPYLWYNRVTIPTYEAYVQLRLRCRQWLGLRAYTARRREIIRRLEAVEAGGSRSDFTTFDNLAYSQAGTPAVSVVVTLYNYARYVRSCLESVAASQTARLPGAIELVVVDDASTDPGAAVVAEFLSTCPLPARLVKKAINTGLADARNLGLQQARAEYVFILDADNFVYPRCLERLYQTIRASNSAAAFGIIACFDDQTGAGVGLHSAFGWDVRQLVRGGYIDAMALFDRARVLAVGGYSTDLVRHGWFGWEDYDLWLKLAAAGHEGRHCPQIVAAYRVHGSSMIRVTNAYLLNFVSHFTTRFAPLIEQVEPIDRVFGWPRPAGLRPVRNRTDL